MTAAAVWLLAALAGASAEIPTGHVVPSVACDADPTQSYALYLPREYSRARNWPLIFAFDPGGRGRTPVERYQAAAEQYGYIVAGSNNSRNGSTDLGRIIAALSADVLMRFAIDQRRIYVAGMSGGARVALTVALGSNAVAGAIASSAGYPDSKPRKTVPFPIFATAGTEDFNHLEMRQLDEALTTPHRLVVFPAVIRGCRVSWRPRPSSGWSCERFRTASCLATRVRSTRCSPDASRRRTLALSPKDAFLAASWMVEDFTGLKDVSKYATRAAALERTKDVRAALKSDRDEDAREERTFNDVVAVERRLGSDDERTATLMQLRQLWRRLSEDAGRQADSADRRIARRVLANLSADASRRTDPDYAKIINEYRPARGR